MDQWKVIQDKANQAVRTPSDSVWRRIEYGLDREEKRSGYFRWAWTGWAAAALLLVMMVVKNIPGPASSGYAVQNLEISSDASADFLHFETIRYPKREVARDQPTGRLIPNYRLLDKSPLVVNADS